MKPDAVARHRRWLAAFLTLFALSQAALWLAYYGAGEKALIGDEQSYQTTALSILAGGRWMPGTIWPPLQPLWLALLYALFGVHVWVAQLAQTLLLIASAGLLRDFWRRVGGNVAAANGAAALLLLNPATAAYAHWLWPETLHLFLLLAALCLLARLRAFAAGAAVGFAILAKSLLSVFWPAFLLAFVQRGQLPRAVRLAVAFVLGLGLVTAPALWHGWREYGKPMIADSSIYNVWIGLTDRWRSDYVEDMGGVTLPAFLASAATPQQRNALYLDKVRGLVADRGLPTLLMDQFGRQYFRLFSAKTPLVSQLPGPACAGHLSAYHSPPWLTRGLTVANDVFHALVLAAAAFGAVAWRRRPDRLLALVALFAAYQFALFALVHVKARFLLPLWPFMCGFAATFLCARRERADAHAAIALTPLRLAAGAALAALLLLFAFAGPAFDGLCAG
jgi:4-amino-4-deoxy-L-arabinose transferase-like glycosyltransferase